MGGKPPEKINDLVYNFLYKIAVKWAIHKNSAISKALLGKF